MGWEIQPHHGWIEGECYQQGYLSGGGNQTAVAAVDGRVAKLDVGVDSGACAGNGAPPGEPSDARSYHCTCWSKTYEEPVRELGFSRNHRADIRCRQPVFQGC